MVNYLLSLDFSHAHTGYTLICSYNWNSCVKGLFFIICNWGSLPHKPVSTARVPAISGNKIAPKKNTLTDSDYGTWGSVSWTNLGSKCESLQGSCPCWRRNTGHTHPWLWASHLGSRFMREAYTWLHASADMPGRPATLIVCSTSIFKFRGKVCARLTSSRTWKRSRLSSAHGRATAQLHWLFVGCL